MSQENLPKATVIIPTYNRAKTLERSIKSVLTQTFSDYELIIIDDGSTDNTKELIIDIKDDRIHYIKSPVNRGAANARNIGIRAAKGEYIAFQDSDDEWLPEKLEKQVTALDKTDGETGMVYTGFFYDFGENGILEYPPKDMPYEIKSGYIYPQMLKRNLIGTPTMLVRKGCLNKVGMFNTTLKSLEDWELCLRISKEYKVYFVDESLHKAYITPGSLSSDIIASIQSTCCMLKLYKDDIIKFDILEYKIKEIQNYAKKINKIDEVNKIIDSIIE